MSHEHDHITEPERDPRLHAALVEAFGETPRDVDWSALAARTRSAARFRLRQRARQSAWWQLAGQWAGRALPVGALAAAAALLFAIFTPRTSESPAATNESDTIATVVAGTPAQAAQTVASSTLDERWLWNATLANAPAEGQ